MYDTPGDLLRAIRAGEDSFLELKQVFREGKRLTIEGEGKAASAVAKWLCCFANADGGVIVFGVTDSQQIVGLPPGSLDDLQQLVVNAGRDGCEPPLDHLLTLDAVDLGGAEALTVLKVDVRPARSSVHAPRGQRPTMRVGNTCREVSMEYLPRLLERRGSMEPFEERPVIGAGDDDIDYTRLNRFVSERFGGPVPDLARTARNLKVMAVDEAGAAHPTVVGLLIFGRDPSQHLGAVGIELTHYSGEIADADHQLDSRRFGGTAVDQLDDTLRYLSTSSAITTRARKDSIGRIDQPSYEMRAIQEAVVNAVAHRDYQLRGAPIRVFLFDDRIEVTSPGGLPNSLTVDDLFGGALPFRRNQLLVGFLRDAPSEVTQRSYMEARGEGFLTMVRLTQDLAGRPPEVKLGSETVTIVLPAARTES